MMAKPMPSPIGHVLAGLTVAFAARGPRHPLGWRLALVCALLAALPDADLLVAPALHRTVTHSVTSAAFITIVAMLVTGWVTRWTNAGRIVWIGALCGASWGSHIVLDWLGSDPSRPHGIQALWPFSREWFISGWDVFPGTERRDPFTLAATVQNAKAAIVELALMGGLALGTWWVRRRTSVP
jgi:inner membrane protein